MAKRDDKTGRCMYCIGQCTENGTDNEKGDFLCHKTKENIFGFMFSLGERMISPERPVIEQQENKGEGHDHWLGHETEDERTHCGHISHGTLARYVIVIGQKGAHPEKGAQNVFPFADPDHRFDSQWMKGKQKGDKSASPHRPGHEPEHPIKEQAVSHVEEYVGQMVAGRIEAIELVIAQEREPGNRHPEPCGNVGERPADAAPAQPRLNIRVLRDI